MSGGCEREARSVALEKAYVHEVYQQISAEYPNTHKSRSWPRIKQFLEDLEPGSLVCDVGCGNGKYLGVNPSIFNLGADRCTKLVESAKEKDNEVLVCDNLALPFRDETFDAVLSIAVVHHFATTERRVNALRELARVLRIGGRLVISVWAMEQRHRKFESQDVLVPWHRPQHLSTPSLELTSTTTNTSEEDGPPPYHAYTQTSDTDSCRSVRAAGSGQRKRGRSRHKGRSIDPTKPITSSPSSSSLSSPNETCYSFVRRALQKLAGGKRGGSRHRPWFLESWTSCAAKESPPRRYEPEGCEDIQDLPIELRRLEDDQEAPQRRQTFACSHQLSDVPLNHKSKSLSDIINVEQKGIVRSRSSVPSLEVGPPEEETVEEKGTTKDVATTSLKPRLVKQKKSMCEEDFEGEEGDEPTDMKDLIKALPDFRVSGQGSSKKGSMFKQSSMNEELMSTERLREKERVRQNIQKQASLNEDLMFRRNRTLDSLRDTLFSASTAKRFQLLKSGLSNKIKSSTTGIEKVAGTSLKNGFVRILQNWTSSDVAGGPIPQPAPPPPPTPPPDSKKLIVEEKKDGERRHSREDGSDSSKDSSLQSDTSVDSEDSFASVIFVPKPEPPPEKTSTNTSPTMQSTPASPSSSPKFKLPPPISPKLKNAPQISFGMSSHPSSPKLKHPGQLLGSQTPTSPKGRFYSQPTSPRPYQTSFLTSPTSKNPFKLQSSPNGTQTTSPTCKIFPLTNVPKLRTTVCSYTLPNISHLTPTSPTADQPSSQLETSPVLSPVKQPLLRTPSPKDTLTKAKSLTSPKEETLSSGFLDLRPTLSPGLSPTSPCKDTTKRLIVSLDDPPVPEKTLEKSAERLKQIQEILKQKQSTSSSSISRTPQSHFPLVKRSATVGSVAKSNSETRAVTKLMSLELFNPETDDMDSDSSGVSSPDSVGSVISVLNEEELTTSTGQDLDQQKQPDQKQASQTEKQDTSVEHLEKVPPVNSSCTTTSDIQIITPEGSVAKIKPTSNIPIVSQTVQSEIVRLEVEQIECEGAKAIIKSPRISPSHSLLEAAADVASTLEETVDAVIQSSPRAKRKQLKLFETPDPLTILQDDLVTRRSPHRIDEIKLSPARLHSDRMNWNTSLQTDDNLEERNRWERLQQQQISSQLPQLLTSEDDVQNLSVKENVITKNLGAIPKKITKSRLHLDDLDLTRKERIVINHDLQDDFRDISTSDERDAKTKVETWDEECRQHLADFAEKLSEKLLIEIDRYREQGCSSTATGSTQMKLSPELIPHIKLQSDIEIMNDPYLNKLSEELQDLTKLSKELQEKHNTFLNEIKGIELSSSKSFSSIDTKSSPTVPVNITNVQHDTDYSLVSKSLKPCDIDYSSVSKIKHLEDTSSSFLSSITKNNSDESQSNREIPLSDLASALSTTGNMSLVEIATVKLLKENEKLLRTLENSDKLKTISRRSYEQDNDISSSSLLDNNFSNSSDYVNRDVLNKKPELFIESSDIEESDDGWSGSRRNTIFQIDEKDRKVDDDQRNDDVTRIELFPGSDMPRRPSISVETSDPNSTERILKEKTDMSSSNESRPLNSGISLESSDAGDLSERTASSSDGSRAGSRRDTIQVCDSGSVLSLRPGLSLESSEAGDISERTGSGSESSRAGDSRRNTISIDHTSGSQASLLRPGTSMESSEAGDISERTGSGSDCSRRDTSSAGKTASTASLISDRAGSDCSKDTRYADRRIARADGRSSSEETASNRSGLNKLVRQRASTQEPPEMLTKTESCETSLSGSTSQESLMSDSGGGAITFHRYYHVFREGELDQLIERYVENLHIISSYYDHANWCVIAEKVHVWTI